MEQRATQQRPELLSEVKDIILILNSVNSQLAKQTELLARLVKDSTKKLPTEFLPRDEDWVEDVFKTWHLSLAPEWQKFEGIRAWFRHLVVTYPDQLPINASSTSTTMKQSQERSDAVKALMDAWTEKLTADCVHPTVDKNSLWVYFDWLLPQGEKGGLKVSKLEMQYDSQGYAEIENGVGMVCLKHAY